MDAFSTIQIIAVMALPLIFGITLHEAAHGYVAARCGDKTALMMGRVSLNPAKHADVFGTLILPTIMMLTTGFIFGWAKPVPVTWSNLRHPRRDMALVALAGPAANLVMAIAWGLIAKLSSTLLLNNSVSGGGQTIATYFFSAGKYGILINSILLVLNLIPIPPLDGSRVVSSLLRGRVLYYYDRIEPYGIWILLALLIIGLLGKLIQLPTYLLINSIMNLLNLPTI